MEHQYRMGIDTIGFTKFGLVQLRHFYNEEQNLQFPSQSPQVLNSNLGNTGLVVNQPDIKPPVKDKKRRTRGTPAQVRPCKVCGESAGKHSYYGGEVCPSCRAFFRRSVQSGYNNSYKCDEGGTCKVTLATRKKCQHCRYRLCLAAGMKTSWVLTEEERKQKFEGKGKAYRKLDVDVKKAVDVDLSDEEMLQINNLVKTSGHFEMSKVNDMETSLLRNIVKMIAFKHPLPASGQKQLREVLTRRFKKIAKRVPEFTMLCYRDREEILVQNIPYLVEMHICSYFKPCMTWQEQFTPLMGEEEVDKLYNKLKSLNVTGLADLRVPMWFIFTSEEVQYVPRFKESLEYIGGWAEEGIETVLLSLVLLFCPDMLDLMERRRVEEIQTKFAVLLQKYLNTKHKGNPGVSMSRFTSGLNLVTKCKEFHCQVYK